MKINTNKTLFIIIQANISKGKRKLKIKKNINKSKNRKFR